MQKGDMKVKDWNPRKVEEEIITQVK